MSLVRRFANWTMDAAAALTPPERRGWLEAMRGEFATLEREGDMLDWAGGSLGAALGWRLRSEAVYLAALAVFCFGEMYVLGPADDLARLLGARDFFERAHLTEFMVVGSASLLLCLYRPRRALLTALVVPAVLGCGGMTYFLAEFVPTVIAAPFEWKMNHPQIPNWQMLLLFFWSLWWPSLMAGALVWGATQLGRLRPILYPNRSPR